MNTLRTFTGAVPVIIARLLLMVTLAFTVKLAAFSLAIWLAMLDLAEVIHDFMFEFGFSTFSPLAENAANLASNKEPLLLTSRGPFASSWSARQYMRRNAGWL